MLLSNSVGAVLCASAHLAVTANPNFIKLVHSGFDKRRVIGKDSALEVAAIGGLHTNACAGQIGRAYVGRLAIEYP